MALDPEEAVLEQLVDVAAGAVTLRQGGNLFQGPAIAPDAGRPTLSVFVLGTGGPRNARLMGETVDDQVATVQVTTRADGSDYARGRALAQACLSALHAVPVDGWDMVTVREPAPMYLQRDVSGRHLWAFNVELRRLNVYI